MTPSSVELGELMALLAALATNLHAIAINALRCGTSGVVFLAIRPILSTHQPAPSRALLFVPTSTLTGLGLGESVYFEAFEAHRHRPCEADFDPSARHVR